MESQIECKIRELHLLACGISAKGRETCNVEVISKIHTLTSFLSFTMNCLCIVASIKSMSIPIDFINDKAATLSARAEVGTY